MAEVANKIIHNIQNNRYSQYNHDRNSPNSISLPRLAIDKHFNLSQSQKKRRNFLKRQLSHKQRTNKPQINFLEKYFKMKKINWEHKPIKSFCIDRQQQAHKKSIRKREQINIDIQQSLLYVQHIKSKKSLYEIATYQQKSGHESITDSQVPKFKSNSTNKNYKYKTQGTDVNQQPIGLYSYLQRSLLDVKNPQITQQRIQNFSKSPKNRQFEYIFREKTRKLLKLQVKANRREYLKANDKINAESKQIIASQLRKKRDEYSKEFQTRGHVPYFSYLTLNQKQRKSVLFNLNIKDTQNR